MVGDIHGCYQVFISALTANSFDPSVDRVFSVGDLVDRGPDSENVMALLEKPWFHAIRGNHEDMFNQVAEDPAAYPQKILERNGMLWIKDVPLEKRKSIKRVFQSLPHVIEVATPRGLVGLVHAEVPIGMSWQSFTQEIERANAVVRTACLWGRDRIEGRIAQLVPGIDRIYCGHTVQNAGVRRLGNHFFVDTGSFVRQLGGASKNGLSVLDLACSTQVFNTRERPDSRGFLTTSLEQLDLKKPFSSYKPG